MVRIRLAIPFGHSTRWRGPCDACRIDDSGGIAASYGQVVAAPFSFAYEEARRRAVNTSAQAAMVFLHRAEGASDPSFKAQYLRTAVEMAARAVLTAWGRPAAGANVWRGLFDRLTPSLRSEVIEWARKVELSLPDQATALLRPALHFIVEINALTGAAPPAGWSPRPAPLKWNELSDDDRSFLSKAFRRALEFAPGSDLWLFGSRATGEAREDSDFDVRIVMPDETSNAAQGQATGQLWQTARDFGVKIDHAPILRTAFDHPSETEDVLLIYETQSYGVQVPAL